MRRILEGLEFRPIARFLQGRKGGAAESEGSGARLRNHGSCEVRPEGNRLASEAGSWLRSTSLATLTPVSSERQSRMAQFDVFGVGNALVDIQARVDDSLVSELGFRQRDHDPGR